MMSVAMLLVSGYLWRFWKNKMGLFTTYGNKTDEALMVLIQGGDHRAFHNLYTRYSARLNGFFFKMLWADSEMAEDYVQDLFTKIIDRPELYKTEYKVKPWLFQIAFNMCKNAYRKRSFEQDYRQHLESEGIHLAHIEQKLDHKLQFDLLSQALSELNEDQRTIFLLRYQQEMTVEEISEIFEIPPGTVKSRLFSVRQQLILKVNDDQKITRHGKEQI
ncbi:MAG: sigma-70 family RNA polymerase sigma factor [Marinoscillum sp.]|uniref:RNA polymerase sigma factor n=1 Tax=Marinoscillum sp. TaxID=2024838 RepID=UPI0032FD6180